MRWSSIKPKVWTSRALAVASLMSGQVRGYEYNDTLVFVDAPKDWELIELSINLAEHAKVSCQSVIDQRKRQYGLRKKYGVAFADLVKTVEDKDENDAWQWVLCIGSWDEPTAVAQMQELIKTHKLKKNKDYRSVVRGDAGAFAFKDKGQSSLIRLAFKGECTGINIRDYVEVDVDEPMVAC